MNPNVFTPDTFLEHAKKLSKNSEFFGTYKYVRFEDDSIRLGECTTIDHKTMAEDSESLPSSAGIVGIFGDLNDKDANGWSIRNASRGSMTLQLGSDNDDIDIIRQSLNKAISKQKEASNNE